MQHFFGANVTELTIRASALKVTGGLKKGEIHKIVNFLDDSEPLNEFTKNDGQTDDNESECCLSPKARNLRLHAMVRFIEPLHEAGVVSYFALHNLVFSCLLNYNFCKRHCKGKHYV